MLHEFVDWVLATVDGWGYAGIFVLMSIESSLIPFPSEVVLIPAGYLAYQGSMNLAMIMLAAVLGSLLGAFINYGFALLVGRPFLERYGKYFFVRPALLHKTDAFFLRHGAISTFTGRLIPGIRQLVSLPAGLGRMPIGTFALYTGVGAGLWSAVLVALGYFIGGNEQLIMENLPLVTGGALAFVGLTLATYYLWQRRQPVSTD
ncbi:DedA family protein [Thiorhodococcus mannitoliphagus]|uniref:DedA family protein n=1 Tax=Thiorhodococcus mannitoliphagus TaxID=329406 RepID=A0A6P1E103_9GAMM|nr:DedA family protein [Thiorhodococcus mannitoliphagus]NEX21415.1 DedA family protein [Thiorhodococcus mannitoliphagus]